MIETRGPDLQSSLFWEIWENSPDNMFILRVDEDDFYVLDTNKAQQHTVDMAEMALNSRPLRDVLPPDFYDFVTPNYHNCVTAREPVQYEETELFTSQDGRPHYWSTLLLPVLNDQREVAFIFGISRNITELKSAQALAEKAAAEAERANHVKMAFLANMSHEMRTPLNGIQASADLLTDLCVNDEQREVCGIISRSTAALTRLTGDILEFAKIDAGKLKLENHEFSLKRVCDDATQLLAPEAHRKGIAFRVTITEDLPDVLFGDSGRLRQILLNLAGNAVKFTDMGGVDIVITGELGADDRVELQFAVTDTGIGIRADDFEKLFKPFSQVDDSTTRHYEGSGLGLTISKYLVEKMGGQIEVSSMPGEGSCFTFRIPFRYLAQPTSSPGGQSPVSGVELKGFRVLVVEDNVTNQLVLEKMLALDGMEVTVAHNGRQALEHCQQSSFDLILMDWHMPLMDGLSATRLIRQLPGARGKVPIVGLTASVLDEHRSACLDAGMDEVIAKPVNRALLREVMAAQLQR